MKKLLAIVILLTIIPLAVYCQSEENKVENFHFLEMGIGTGYTRQVHGAFNIAISNSLGRYIANFIDYNMVFGKSQVLFHEYSFKLGPYYKFGRYSYIAASSGLSFIWNSPFTERDYDNFHRYYTTTYSEGEYLINIPIQAKLNIGVYKGFCIGLKGTLNKIINEEVNNKATVLMYLSLGF